MKHLRSKSLRRSLFRNFLFSIICGLVAYHLVSFFATKTHAQGSESSPPVTVHYTVEQYDPAGQLRLTKSRLYARFSDGSMANRYTQLYPKQEPVITEILNATTGDWVYLDPTTDSSITLKRSLPEVRRAISEADTEGCPSGVDLSKLSQLAPILGVRILYYSNTDASGDTEERWMAPDLNCLPLKKIDTSRQHGGAHNVLVATSIKIGEPAEDLKAAPPGYTERTPEQVEEMHIAATGGETFWGRVFLRAMKREYAKNGALMKQY